MLGTNGIAALIDLWKVTKVLKLKGLLSIFFTSSRDEQTKEEKETDDIDAAGSS